MGHDFLDIQYVRWFFLITFCLPGQCEPRSEAQTQLRPSGYSTCVTESCDPSPDKISHTAYQYQVFHTYTFIRTIRSIYIYIYRFEGKCRASWSIVELHYCQNAFNVYFLLYCMSKKAWPILWNNFLYTMEQNFLDVDHMYVSLKYTYIWTSRKSSFLIQYLQNLDVKYMQRSIPTRRQGFGRQGCPPPLILE